ncbi:hypothetical protein FGO68_gene7477 [Halteria grandinella]|uniref:Uncharacterized protein n=1 Tax=Halteria grandinella TaxID=5974 RepID=A0A8J8NKL7_HALGN|nr:hypothetical protein FGO68_gene7477 [Halteria grandinella]
MNCAILNIIRKMNEERQRKASVLEKPATAINHDEESDHDEEVEKPEEEKKSLYEQFVESNKKRWTIFNIVTTLASVGMAIGTFFVIRAHEEDCLNLQQTLYLVFVMHIVNSLETILNVTGMEKKLCTGFWVCMFFIFEMTVIVYMQVVYFAAMPSDVNLAKPDCTDLAPMLYYWMMFNILYLYLGGAIVICYFFRGFCQDPELEKEEEAKYEKNRKLYEQRKAEAEGKKLPLMIKREAENVDVAPPAKETARGVSVKKVN